MQESGSRPISRPILGRVSVNRPSANTIGRYVGRHSADTAADMLRSTVGGVSVDCRCYRSFDEIATVSCSICSHFGLPFTIYVAITFCPFVSLEQRALALALFHISQLNNGMRYQTVLEQVTLQSSKGTFRE